MAIVLHLSYQLPENKKGKSIKLQIPQTARTLANVVGRNSEAHIVKELQKHLGRNSTYALKKSLIESFELLQFYLYDSNTSQDTKHKIAEAILHEIEQCTPGFHDRVNHVLSGLTRPETIDQILEVLRNAIVDRVARQITDEVHQHNTIVMQAVREGYGVRSINQDDLYLGGGRPQITKVLRESFAKHYSALSILRDFRVVLEGEFRDRFGYAGKSSEGYTLATYERVNIFLNRIFEKNLSIYELFLVDEMTDKIEDIIWPKIYQELLNTLHQKGYIKFEEKEHLFLNELFKEDSSVDFSLLNKEEAESLNLIAYPELLNHCSTKVQLHLLSCVKDNMTYGDLHNWFIQLSLNVNEDEKKKLLKSMLEVWLTKPNLCLAKELSESHPFEVEVLIEVVSSLAPEYQSQVMFSTNAKNKNMFQVLIENKPQSIPALIQFALSTNELMEQVMTLSIPDKSINLWLYAAQKNKEGLSLLIDALKNPLIKKIFLSTTTSTSTLFMMAIKHQLPSDVALMLHEILQFSDEKQSAVFFTQEKCKDVFNYGGENCLMHALKTPSIFKHLINNLTPFQKKKIFSQKDALNNNILMKAVYYPNSLPLVLDAFKELAEDELLSSFFIERNLSYDADANIEEGLTLLELASILAPASLPLLLDVLMTEPALFPYQNQLLKNNYLQKTFSYMPKGFAVLLEELVQRQYGIDMLMSPENENLICSALSNQSIDQSKLIQVLSSLPNPILEKLLINNKTNEHLLNTLETNASLVADLLKLVSKFPEENQHQIILANSLSWTRALLLHPEHILSVPTINPNIWIALLSAKDKKGRNVIMGLACFHPEYLPKVLSYIQQHFPEQQGYILANTLSQVSLYKSEAISHLLEEILKLTPEDKRKFFQEENVQSLIWIITNKPAFINSVVPLLSDITSEALKAVLTTDINGTNPWLKVINENASLEAKNIFFKELSRLKFAEQYSLLKSYKSECKVQLEQGIEQINIVPLKKHLKILPMDSQARTLDILDEIRSKNLDYEEAICRELKNKMSPLSQALSIKKWGFFQVFFDSSLVSTKESRLNLQ